MKAVIFNTGMKISFSGNYHDCLSDIKAATALQPSYLKAIFRGENERKSKILNFYCLYFITLSKNDFVLLGANTCVKLKQFDEAIVWCDKGLAVSFTNNGTRQLSF